MEKKVLLKKYLGRYNQRGWELDVEDEGEK